MGIGAYDYWTERDAMVLLVMGIIGVLLSLWILASYHQLKIIIDGSFLKVHYFFQVYETDISKITKIRKGETMWSGFHKYGTATKGLIIFARYKNDLYITPEDEELFYQKILAVNPNVTVEKVEH
jgi:hypothetical protein